MNRTRSTLVTALSVGVVATMATTLTTTSAEAAHHRPAGHNVTVKITKKHVVRMPKRLRPGVHRFTIKSARPAELQIVHEHKGYTDKELARDANAAMGRGDTKALKRFERNTTFIGGVVTVPGQRGTLVARLARGKYVALDINAPGTRPGKMFHFSVVGKRLKAKTPKAPTITARHAVDFGANPTSIPTKGLLTFANRSTDNHFIELGKLAEGKTMADFEAWIDATMQGQDAPPPVDGQFSIESGIVSPGHRMTFGYSLPPGDYVVACWWPDADMQGMPHAFMGMYRGITVE